MVMSFPSRRVTPLADLEVVGLGVVEDRGRQTAKPQVDRAVMVDRGLDGGFRLNVVRRDDDGHAGDGPHQRDILAALVGRAVLADRDAGVGRADLDRQAGVADRVADNLKRPPGGKHRKGGGENGHAGGGKARRDAHHVRFGNAAVEETVGIRFLEDAGLGRGREVGVQDDKVRVFRRQFL